MVGLTSVRNDRYTDCDIKVVSMEEFLGMIPELLQTPAEEVLLKGTKEKAVYFTDFLLRYGQE